jgi:hypothetical protein
MRYLERTLHVVGGLLWIASGYSSLSIAAEPLLPIGREWLDETTPSPMTLWFAVLWLAGIVIGHVGPLLVPFAWVRSRSAAICWLVVCGGFLVSIGFVEGRAAAGTVNVTALAPGLQADLVAVAIASKLLMAAVAVGLVALRSFPGKGHASERELQDDQAIGWHPSSRAATRGAADVTPEVVLDYLRAAAAAAVEGVWSVGVLSVDGDAIVISQGKLAPVFGVSKATLCRRLQRLEEEGELDKQQVDGGTRIVLGFDTEDPG